MGKSIIICGSGNSIPFDEAQFKETGTGLSNELITVLSNNYSIGLNSWFKFGVATTFLCFCDDKFYLHHYEQLKKLPLIVGKHQLSITAKNLKLDNTILLPLSEVYWGKESWDVRYKKCQTCGYKILREVKNDYCPTCRTCLQPLGFYSGHLVGLFAITLAIALGFTDIYLLGFDSCEVGGKTHFYQNLVQVNEVNYGIGKESIKNRPPTYRTGTYNDIRALNKKWYAPFVGQANIYNVSEESVINIFPKISYTTFYDKVGSCSVNPLETPTNIRALIVEKLNEKM